MYEVSHQLYLELAERLVAAIGRKEFFSGSVSCIAGDVELRLVCTLIVQRSKAQNLERTTTEITGVVPVLYARPEAHGFTDDVAGVSEYKTMILPAVLGVRINERIPLSYNSFNTSLDS